MARTKGSKRRPSIDEVIRRCTYAVAKFGHYDTSEEALQSGLLTPANLSSVDKCEWHRGFVLRWNACTFGLEEQADEAE